MDREHLKQVLRAHRLWLSSNGKQGKRADLSWANLARANLARANLSWADLHGANLTGADLSRVNLSWACLSWANLTGANLTRVNLTEADLYDADLTWAELGPQIRECLTFEGAQVSEDQLAWLCLHPRFGEWRDSLKVI